MAARAAHRCKNACLFLNRRLNRPRHFPQRIWHIQCGPGCVPASLCAYPFDVALLALPRRSHARASAAIPRQLDACIVGVGLQSPAADRCEPSASDPELVAAGASTRRAGRDGRGIVNCGSTSGCFILSRSNARGETGHACRVIERFWQLRPSRNAGADDRQGEEGSSIALLD
jgi:hypothetical protein